MKYPFLISKGNYHLIKHVPSQNGVSTTLSPHSILSGQPTPSFTDPPLQFGKYVQVHNNPNSQYMYYGVSLSDPGIFSPE